MRVIQKVVLFSATLSLMVHSGSTAVEAQVPAGERVMRELEQAEYVARMYEMPRPIEDADEVWISKMTWMEVRDAIANGTRTVIVPAGAVDQNGPYLVTNKHEVTLGQVCEGVARELGNTLCAPVVDFGRQGDIDPPSGQMRYSGVISVREETFRMMMDDIASSLRAHGFQDIMFITDKGTNESYLRDITQMLNERWEGTGTKAYYVDEQYTRRGRADEAYLQQAIGLEQPCNDGHHDNIVQTSLLFLDDPDNVRWDQREEAGLLTINCVDISDKEWVRDVGATLLEWRIDNAASAMQSRLDSRD